MKRTVSLFALVVLLRMAVPGIAQDRIAKVDIPFGFIAGKVEMPAGQYELRYSVSHPNVLQITPANKGTPINVPVLTSISGRPEAALYFDKTEDNKSYLAEVYFAGSDGIHLQGAPGKHTHTRVTLK